MVRRLSVVVVLLVLAGVGVTLALTSGSDKHRTARACAPAKRDTGERAREERAREGEKKTKGKRPKDGVVGLFSGPAEAESACGDRPGGHPESFADLAKANSGIVAKSVAPGTKLKAGAYRAALHEALDRPTIPGTWSPYGETPLETGRTEYDTSNESTSEGLGNVAGRTTALTRDPATGRLFAATSNGGVWSSVDAGAHWTDISQGLPTQVVSGIAWSTAGGGTLVVLTGDNAFGGDTYAGLGVYRTTDLGGAWTHSTGVPDGVLGFKVAVDPTNEAKVYAATGGGLFRSTDGGATFANVDLPTGANHDANTPDCSGQPVTVKDCFLANMVTDVVVQGADNANTDDAQGHPGAVLAAVGWRSGTQLNDDNAVQAPGNGIYSSDSGPDLGAPGSFTNLDLAAHNTPTVTSGDPLAQNQIGRIALGETTGGTQNHRIVYAIVQDAAKFRGGVSALDVGEPTAGAAQSDYLNAIYASTDFGHTWKELDGSNAIDSDPSSESALAPPSCKAPLVVSYCPGIQAWYNLWVSPDPTRATASGVPTRVAFGLEEVWANDPTTTPPTGIDGTTPQRFKVVGRYFRNCTLITVTNQLPACPTASGATLPDTTTHPDQHGDLWVPDGSGGVDLFAANDGGIYKQHTTSSEDLSNTKWGTGVNQGLHTLQPYDAEMAKDGTVYMGLQDNGEGKVDPPSQTYPKGRSYTVFGGDGFFTAVDPDNADNAYEEYTGGAVSITTDGGKTWTSSDPGLTSPMFATPFQMDPADASHLLIGGQDVKETTKGTSTAPADWTTVFDLGTAASGAANQLSALDVKSFSSSSAPVGGSPTANFQTTAGGGSTIPGGQDIGSTVGDPLTGTFPPGTYEDKPFTIAAGDADAALKVDLTWTDDTSDWDLYLYRKNSDGSLTQVASSAHGSPPTGESLTTPNPPAGDYIARVVNFSATGTFDLKGTFTLRTTANKDLSAAYVGFCGYCDTITQGTPFKNGLATNVGGAAPGKAGDAAGWHKAAAQGLPQRYITSTRMDPNDPRTVYVTLAGYGRRWAFPGAVGEPTGEVGTGHVFKSTDAGQTFTNISGDLPDAPANWSVLHNGHLVVGTDIGVFESCDASGGAFSRLGGDLPTTPVSTLRYKPGDPNTLVAATYGRGVYTFHFGADSGRCAETIKTPPSTGGGTPGGGGTPKTPATVKRCRADRLLTKVSVRRSGHGLRLAAAVARKGRFFARIYRVSQRRRVLRPLLVKSYAARRSAVTWNGKGKRVADGYYVVVFGGALGQGRRRAADPAAPGEAQVLRAPRLRGHRALQAPHGRPRRAP